MQRKWSKETFWGWLGGMALIALAKFLPRSVQDVMGDIAAGFVVLIVVVIMFNKKKIEARFKERETKL